MIERKEANKLLKKAIEKLQASLTKKIVAVDEKIDPAIAVLEKKINEEIQDHEIRIIGVR